MHRRPYTLTDARADARALSARQTARDMRVDGEDYDIHPTDESWHPEREPSGAIIALIAAALAGAVIGAGLVGLLIR